jgi:D,D-heptose 1,7-bisphosphate phosphatase
MRKAVFLDRDGTINFDPGYLNDPGQFRFYPGAVEALRQLSEAGYLIIIISNQSGIARGYFGEDTLKKIHDKMLSAFLAGGITITGIYYCPHHPDDQCECRKPSPKMVLEAARDNAIDLGNSFFIGDRESDIKTGKNAGCETVLVLTGAGKETQKAIKDESRPDYVAKDLPEAARWIIGRGTGL